MKFVKGMGLGWNLGNTLEPVDCAWITDDLGYETAWGNPKTTRALIRFIKAEGFDTIRLPVTWTNHLGAAPDYAINEAWMARVEEIVDWCLDEDLYVILNIHHEGGWLTKASTDYDAVMVKYRAIWTQIAARFGDRSDRLIFESMNEIGFDDLGTTKGAALLEKINGEFLTLIRGSGKSNDSRYLLLAGYWTDIDRTCGNITAHGDDRAIISVHYYSPSTFAIADKTSTWGYQATWGTAAEYAYLVNQLNRLGDAYLSKGIPVIVGEYGCTMTDKEVASRARYLTAVATYGRDWGVCPVLWDNGEEIDRKALAWRTAGLADALRAAY
jgi:endoglucanase